MAGRCIFEGQQTIEQTFVTLNSFQGPSLGLLGDAALDWRAPHSLIDLAAEPGCAMDAETSSA
jgi:hypothetical protein